jgi:hypothetical protein
MNYTVILQANSLLLAYQSAYYLVQVCQLYMIIFTIQDDTITIE